MQLSGIDLVTTDPAPTITLLPMVMSPMITTLAPMVTLSPIIGALLFRVFLEIEPSGLIMVVSPLFPNVAECL